MCVAKSDSIVKGVITNHLMMGGGGQKSGNHLTSLVQSPPSKKKPAIFSGTHGNLEA